MVYSITNWQNQASCISNNGLVNFRKIATNIIRFISYQMFQNDICNICQYYPIFKTLDSVIYLFILPRLELCVVDKHPYSHLTEDFFFLNNQRDHLRQQWVQNPHILNCTVDT